MPPDVLPGVLPIVLEVDVVVVPVVVIVVVVVAAAAVVVIVLIFDVVVVVVDDDAIGDGRALVRSGQSIFKLIGISFLNPKIIDHFKFV